MYQREKDLQVEDTVQTVDKHPTKTTDDKGPLSGPSKVECVLPAAFSILAKRMMLSNPGCLSAFTRAI